MSKSLIEAVAVAGLVLSFAVAGCAHRPVNKAPEPRKEAPKPEVAVSSAAPTEASEPITREEVLRGIDDLKTVYFDYDKYDLRPEARETLKANGAWLKEHGDVRIQLAGHCDQRGTVEYNIALGQRRAEAVRDYLIALGVSGGRIATISYGKEKPLCREVEEPCWHRNRRVDTLGVFPKDEAGPTK